MKKRHFVGTVLDLRCGGEALRRELQPEPAYQGQPIHLWIEDLASSDYHTRDQAIEAIRVIGPEGVSDLVRALHRQETPFAKVGLGLAKWFPFMHLRLQPNAAVIRERAAEQLGEMGRNSEAVL